MKAFQRKDPVRLKRIQPLVAFLLLGAITSALPHARQERKSEQPQQTRTLEPGKVLEDNLRGGEIHSFLINLKKAQYLDVVVQQKGIDLAVSFFDPMGKLVWQLDSPNGQEGPENLTSMTFEAGVFRLVLQPVRNDAHTGNYSVQIREVRDAGFADATRIVDRRDALEKLTNAQILAHSEEVDLRGKAFGEFQAALTLWESLGDNYWQAYTLNKTALLRAQLGEVAQALELFKQALSIATAAKDLEGESVTLNNLGSFYDDRGERQKAIECFSRARLLLHELHDVVGEASVLNNLGVVYDTLGEKQTALDCYTKSLDIAREVGDQSAEAACLTNIGTLYQELAEYQKALEYHHQALPILRSFHDRRNEATVLSNIGIAYSHLGEKVKALDYLNQALSIHLAMGNRSGEGVVLANMATLLMSEHKEQQGTEYYKRALQIARETADRGSEAVILSSIGVAYAHAGDGQNAIRSYQDALKLTRLIGDRRIEASTLHNLMEYWAELNAPLAIYYGKQAVNIYQELRTDISGLDSKVQASFLHAQEDTYRDLAELLIDAGRLPEAQQVLDLLKAEEYFEFVRRDGVEGSSLKGRAELSAQEVDLDKRYRDIADRVATIGAEYGLLREKQTRTAAEDQRLSRLEQDLVVANQAFQRFLDDLDKSFSASGTATEKVFQLRESQGLMDTLRELGSGAVALYTIVGNEKLSIILVTPDFQKAYDFQITAADLNRKILSLRQAIQNPRTDPRPAAQELYRILIGPALTHDLEIAKAQTIMWSLDGVLRYLPVAALYDGRQYLVERYRNVVFTPASQTRLKDAVTPRWTALGMGVSKQQEGFNALPGVPQELRGIIKDNTSTGQSTGVLAGKVMLDEAFTAAAMQTALRQRYPLVHIATHFQFRPGNETDSFLLLGDGSHLTLAQVKNLPNIFSGVDLLTLSACDTASGSAGANGKEVEGFAVLAQRQGAKAVVATLWPVADESTQLLMREFYRLHEANPQWNKAEALRQAQLHLLRGELKSTAATSNRSKVIEGGAAEASQSATPFTVDPKAPFAHPYFWAPFILIGNWR